MLSQPMPWDLVVSSARHWLSSSLVMVLQSRPRSRRALTKSHCIESVRDVKLTYYILICEGSNATEAGDNTHELRKKADPERTIIYSPLAHAKIHNIHVYTCRSCLTDTRKRIYKSEYISIHRHIHEFCECNSTTTTVSYATHRKHTYTHKNTHIHI